MAAFEPDCSVMHTAADSMSRMAGELVLTSMSQCGPTCCLLLKSGRMHCYKALQTTEH